MNEKRLLKFAVVTALSAGLGACSKDRKSAQTSPTPPLIAGPAKTNLPGKDTACPEGAEGLWQVQEPNGKLTTFAVAKVDGVMRFTLGGYLEQILVNGQTQTLTGNVQDKPRKTVEISARCEGGVILMTEKDSGRVAESEWRLNGAESLGNLTVKWNGQEQVLVLRKLAVPDGDVP